MDQPRRYYLQRGLTLAEIAMALFIIGVGVLSILTVYLQTERTASTTAQQALAHKLAAEMADRITAKQTADVRFENAIGVRCASTPAASARNALANIAQISAINAVACWQESVAQELPSGAGSIALDESIVPPNYAVTVSWSQPRGGLASYTVRVPASLVATPASAATPAVTPAVNPATNSAPKSTVARAAN